MPRGNQLIRQWRLLRAIESSRYGRTASELHDEVAELGSPRTVYRDLEALQGAGFPLYQDEDGRWRLLSPSEGGPAVPIQPTEMVALLLSEQAMAPLAGSELGEPLVRLRAKLESMLGPKARAYVERLRGGLLATVSAPRRLHRPPHRARGDRAGHPRQPPPPPGPLRRPPRRDPRPRRRSVRRLVHRRRPLPGRLRPPPRRPPQVPGRPDPLGHRSRRDLHPRPQLRPAGLRRPRLPGLARRDPPRRRRLPPRPRPPPPRARYHRTQKLHDLPDGRCRVTFDAAGLPDLAATLSDFGEIHRVPQRDGLTQEPLPE